MISKNSIENLKNIVDIADVVGSYIQLKKYGANLLDKISPSCYNSS